MFEITLEFTNDSKLQYEIFRQYLINLRKRAQSTYNLPSELHGLIKLMEKKSNLSQKKSTSSLIEKKDEAELSPWPTAKVLECTINEYIRANLRDKNFIQDLLVALWEAAQNRQQRLKKNDNMITADNYATSSYSYELPEDSAITFLKAHCAIIPSAAPTPKSEELNEHQKKHISLVFWRIVAAARARMGTELSLCVGPAFFNSIPRTFPSEIEEGLNLFGPNANLFSAQLPYWLNTLDAALDTDNPSVYLDNLLHPRDPLTPLKLFFSTAKAAVINNLFDADDKVLTVDTTTPLGKKLYLVAHFAGFSRSGFGAHMKISSDGKSYYNSAKAIPAIVAGIKSSETLKKRGKGSANTLSILETGTPLSAKIKPRAIEMLSKMGPPI